MPPQANLLAFKLSNHKKVHLPDKQAIQTLQPIKIAKIKGQETVAQDRKSHVPTVASLTRCRWIVSGRPVAEPRRQFFGASSSSSVYLSGSTSLSIYLFCHCLERHANQMCLGPFRESLEASIQTTSVIRPADIEWFAWEPNPQK